LTPLSTGVWIVVMNFSVLWVIGPVRETGQDWSCRNARPGRSARA
jgi:hypothetical protein